MKTNAIVRDGKKKRFGEEYRMEVRHRGVVKMKGTDDKRHTKGRASHIVKKRRQRERRQFSPRTGEKIKD